MELLINLFYVLSLSCDTKGVLAWLRFFFFLPFFSFSSVITVSPALFFPPF